MIRVTDTIALDERELEERFILASGPGGQNVNKVASAVQLRFDASACEQLPDDLRRRLARLAGRRQTLEGVIIITAARFRSQERNRADAIERLVELIRSASVAPKRRKATRPTKAAVERRLQTKAKRGTVKSLRGRPAPDG